MLKILFFNIIVKPLLLIIMGLNVKNRDKLPVKGPAIIIANHNSHLDTLSIMSLFENNLLKQVRPIGAVDYFFGNKYTSWLSENLLGIIPLDRKVKGKDPLENICKSLSNNEIVIIFPEGTRGTPEEIKEFKSGIFHISKKNQNVPIIPMFMKGMGKSLPRNEALFVPFIGYINIGDEIYYKENESKSEYMENIKLVFNDLENEIEH